MLGIPPYHHDCIRKYITVFGTLFNDISVQRDANDSTTTQTLKVPITYSAKDKFITRVKGNPDAEKEIATQLPRMAFEMIDINYDPSRMFNRLNKIKLSDTSFTYNPVPYNILVSLYVATKGTTDGLRIIEQILPFFTPQFNVPMNILPGGCVEDVPFILNDVSHIDTYEGDFETLRAIIWTLNFTIKGYIYGPIRESKLIKHATVNLYDSMSNFQNQLGRITVQPGLDADGNPTTNINETIPYQQIEKTDDWAFIIDLDAEF